MITDSILADQIEEKLTVRMRPIRDLHEKLHDTANRFQCSSIRSDHLDGKDPSRIISGNYQS